MLRSSRILLLMAAYIGVAVSAASAVEIRQQSGVRPLRPEGALIIGGRIGSTSSDQGARKCYGSTLCGESGTYFSDQGVLHYKNGDPIEDRGGRASGVKPATPSVNHIQWCQNRYRSYSANDNTYQPFAGTRRDCSSPFGG